jgi:hypothetical protein
VTEPIDQPRRGRKPLPPGQAKVKRNVRLGPIWEEAERELSAGEPMIHFIEEAFRREITRRRRARRRNEDAPPTEV